MLCVEPGAWGEVESESEAVVVDGGLEGVSDAVPVGGVGFAVVDFVEGEAWCAGGFVRQDVDAEVVWSLGDGGGCGDAGY